MSGSPPGTRSTPFVLLAAVVLTLLSHTSVSAQQAGSPPAAGVIQGEVSTQSATIAIGGAEVTLTRGGVEAGRVSSEGDGEFRFENLPPGEYTVTAALEGFQPRTADVKLDGGQTAT